MCVCVCVHACMHACMCVYIIYVCVCVCVRIFVCVQLVLPLGFERKDDKVYEEINIPPSDPAPVGIGKDRVRVDSLDEVCFTSSFY